MKKISQVVVSGLALSLSLGSIAAETAKDEVVCKKARASIYQHYSKKCMTENEWKSWTVKAEKQMKRQSSIANVSPNQKAILEEGDSQITAKVARKNHPVSSRSSDRNANNHRELAKLR
ncbi:hypothetical protein [Pseudoteredinibacter isoporae]|uniref:hypothetical protein n=1 Tax=Pseudoteredinibacter isoporae TaxID=570281 RepID=UPI003103758C